MAAARGGPKNTPRITRHPEVENCREHDAQGGGNGRIHHSLQPRNATAHFAQAGQPDHQDTGWNGNRKHARNGAGGPPHVPARGRYKGEHVGARRKTRKPISDSELLRRNPSSTAQLPLQAGDGGFPAAYGGITDAKEHGG